MLDYGYYNEDCLEGMKKIDDNAIDLIITDLPYGTTKNAWDKVIPFDKLWEQYERIAKDNAAILLFSSQPFTTDLINSNRKMFRYDLVWDKVLSSGFLNCHKMPMRTHETICVFYKNPPKYNPIMEVRGKPRNKGRKKSVAQTDKTCYGNYGAAELYNNEYYPKSIITKSNGNRTDNRFHSTMKPVSLIEYLILTYSDVGDVVLDSCCGSCSTGVAAHRTGRKFIGFELDEEYYKLSKQRLDEEMSQMTIYDLIETP